MRRPVSGFAAVTLVPVVAVLALADSPAAAADGGCDPSGQYAFVCGLRNAEDLVVVPGTKWIIASSLAAVGGLYLVDSEQKSWTRLYPADVPRAEPDGDTYGACPDAPAAEAFVTHGLNLRAGTDGHSTLYVVGHGGREAIEVFDVDANGEMPVLTWRGCVLTPDGMAANSVASLADGSLLTTIPLHTGVPISDALAGKPTGGIYKWSPGETGFAMVQGTELPYANGIEASGDGQEFYVASSGQMTVTAYSNTNPARVLRRSEPLPFLPDNLHMSPEGKLLTAGLDIADAGCGEIKRSGEFDLEEFASCPRPFTVVAVDPQTMQVEVVVTGPANPQFSNITMALPVGGELWIGTFVGDRIAHTTVTEFAIRYAQAWSSQDPALLASFYAENGSLTINDGEPLVGRAAIKQTAREFMTAFPDMVVRLVGVERKDAQVIFRWHWTGTNTGPGGTGNAVDLTGYEQWVLGRDGLILESLGHYDEAEYQRQVATDKLLCEVARGGSTLRYLVDIDDRARQVNVTNADGGQSMPVTIIELAPERVAVAFNSLVLDPTEFVREGKIVRLSLALNSGALIDRSTNTIVEAGYVMDDKGEELSLEQLRAMKAEEEAQLVRKKSGPSHHPFFWMFLETATYRHEGTCHVAPPRPGT